MPDFTMSPPAPRAGAHPHDDVPVNACFHPGDPAALAEQATRPNSCFHPGDDMALAHWEAQPVRVCFHPGDDVALAERQAQPVRICFHPDDDPAADLHRSLTGIDERHLAAVAGR